MRALQSSMKFSGLDELIEAVVKPKGPFPLPSNSVVGLRRIVYMDERDLFRQLTVGPHTAFQSRSFTVLRDLPRVPPASPESNVPNGSASRPSERELKDPIATTSKDRPYGVEHSEATPVPFSRSAFSSEEERAARRIQKCFRRYRDRQKGAREGISHAADEKKTTPVLSNRLEFSTEERLAVLRIQECFRRYRNRKKGGRGGPIYAAFCERLDALDSKGLGHEQNGLYRIYLRGMMPRVVRLLSKLLDTARLAKKQVDRGMRTSRKEFIDDSVLERRSLIV